MVRDDGAARAGSERARHTSTQRSDQLHAQLDAALAPDFEVRRLLGTGSTAHVFLAHDIALDKAVSVKVLHSDLARTADGRVRFERAARAAANIEHPNVVIVHRFGVLPAGEPFVVMQYVRGRTLEQMLAAEGPIKAGAVRRIVADVADALAAAHAAGVVHRDVRPDNILLDENGGRVLLTDFGLAGTTEAWAHAQSPRVTRTGQVLGDLRYLSPEQAAGLYASEATDVFALAVVALEMLTARRPAEGDRLAAATARTRGETPAVPESVERDDPALALWLRRCLNPQPGARPSARTLADRLREPPDRAAEPEDARWGWLPEWLRDGWNALARRKVPQWVAGVSAAGWILLQVISEFIDRGRLAPGVWDAGVLVLVAGTVGAAILAWFHGERGDQRFRPLEIALLTIVALACITTIFVVLG